MKFDDVYEAELIECYLKDAAIYWKKRKQEFNGDIPSMQIDGAKFCGGNIDLETIERNLKECTELVGKVCAEVYELMQDDG